MKRIALRNCKNKIIKYAIVDDIDFNILNSYKWGLLKCKNGNKLYARRATYPNGANGKQVLVLMHRQILNVNGYDCKVDHKDHNGLNNQRQNLRLATNSQNCANKNRKNKHSGFYGVSLKRKGGKASGWVAQICQKYIGHFQDKTDAAFAYDFCAMELHGEFASLNFKYK